MRETISVTALRDPLLEKKSRSKLLSSPTLPVSKNLEVSREVNVADSLPKTLPSTRLSLPISLCAVCVSLEGQ